jgi:hypothetical protein
MTGPIPGQGETPQPWGGRPRESGRLPDHGSTTRDGDPTGPLYVDAGTRAAFAGPQRGPRRSVLVAIAVAVVVIVGAGVTLWFTAGPGHGSNPLPVAQTSERPVPPRSAVRPPVSSSPDVAAAYDVGSCFDEGTGGQTGHVQLNPVACGGADAVFVINSVVPTAARCDVGADYHNHGYEVPDVTANVAYCASLVVPVDVCFVIGGSTPIARTPCGAAPNVVQVLAIESAPNPASACRDKPNPDVWYFQAPTSGQFACVSRPGSTGTATTPLTFSTTVPATATTTTPAG